MALESTRPIIEMSTRNLPGGKGRPAHKAESLTALCEPIIHKICCLGVWQPYGPPRPVIGIALPFFNPWSKLETFPPATSVMPQDLALQQGGSWLQATSANLWTFSTNITSPWGYSFLCLILLSYVTIVLFVLFYCLGLNFSRVLVPVLVLASV
jgi:hypothetical protein